MIRKRLEPMEDAEILAFVCEHDIREDVARALALPFEPQPRENSSDNANIPAPKLGNVSLLDDTKHASEAWLRVRVLPGLELRVASDASDLVRRVVEGICSACSETKSDSTKRP
jgi:hypothetical protein